MTVQSPRGSSRLKQGRLEACVGRFSSLDSPCVELGYYGRRDTYATVEGDIAEVVNGAGSLLRVIGEKYRATALTSECEDVVEQARRCYLSDWVRLKPLSPFGNIVWITRQSWSSTVELLIGKWTDIEGIE